MDKNIKTKEDWNKLRKALNKIWENPDKYPDSLEWDWEEQKWKKTK